MAFVEFEKVSKIYHTGAVEIPALRDATFQVEKGEICVIVGASGAGKTTLLNIWGDGYPHRRHGEAGWPGYLPLRPAAADGVPTPRRGLCVPVL